MNLASLRTFLFNLAEPTPSDRLTAIEARLTALESKS